jgi:SagB-type dehydrogenase family enzyme
VNGGAPSRGIALRRLETRASARLSIEQAIGPAVQPLWQRLGNGPLPLAELEAEFEDTLPQLYAFVQRLWANCGLALGWPAGDPELEIEPAVAGEVLKLGVGMPTDRWKVSRFAQLHVDDSGSTLIETPRIPVITRILKPRVAAVLVALAVPRTAAEMLAELRWRSTSKELLEMLALLWSAGVITRCDAEGLSEEDAQPELLQWEPHDLAFHMRSRQGRHSYPMGASFRFRGRLDPHPAVKPNPWRERAIALPKFDLAAIAARDPPFTTVLEFRRSIRAMDFSRPISLAQIAEFLFRTARVRHRFNTEIGEFTSRPYPNGGASYEFELYLTINACAGLERGFYYYDPEGHTLSLVRRPNEDTEALLDDAWVSSARQCRPQVLITIASRFHRVSWKYSGMAYAAQLKNAGVLYQTFYLVATAMNLAGCGLGLGDAARFARLTEISNFEEGSVGEFMLGTPA